MDVVADSGLIDLSDDEATRVRDSESESEFDADDSGDLVRSTSGAKPGRRRVKQELAPEDAPLKRAEGAGRSNGKHRNPGSAAQALRVIRR
jgi:hypothetical protein